jgi:solute:Na+ symporter, SSS family
MILTALDWSIVFAIFLLMLAPLVISRSSVRSVADFLSAGRSAGRYLIAVSSGAAAIGSITIVANFEMNLVAGFSLTWWGMTMGVIVLVATACGWVIYRYRQTRCMTLAQFFELRYSRNFRIFAGFLAFFAGIINMGIFPAVEARLFLYFCGFPPVVHILGLGISTFALIMMILLGISLAFVFSGGQVAVLLIDFIQGSFMSIAMLGMVLYFVVAVDWHYIQEALSTAPANASLINPFHTSQVKDFNFWYFLIGVFGFLYGAMSWQGTQAYNSSAENAHEAKMAGVIGLWRGLPQTIMLSFIPIVAYTVLHHPHFSAVAAEVERSISGLQPEAVQSQLKVPMVLRQMLPVGMIGLFTAIAFCTSITNFNSYLHSWGTILTQDVILPLRRRPFTTRQHIWMLRGSILFVGVFIFCFSLIFRQTQAIMLFFAITGAIFAGGSGAIIIGGLYWKRGTVSAAWTAMITGSSIAVGGIIIHELDRTDLGAFNILKKINGQEYWAIAMIGSSLMYVLISLMSRGKPFNLDKLLHRGAYAIAEDQHVVTQASKRWRWLGMGKEFTTRDRIIYLANYVWTFAWFTVFVVGTIYNLTHEVSDGAWMTFWKVQLGVNISLAVITVIWFTTGGFLDLRRMIARLKTRTRDHNDDGFVRHRIEETDPGAES